MTVGCQGVDGSMTENKVTDLRGITKTRSVTFLLIRNFSADFARESPYSSR